MKTQGHDADQDDLQGAEQEALTRFISRIAPERRVSPRFTKARRPTVSNNAGMHRRRNKRFYC